MSVYVRYVSFSFRSFIEASGLFETLPKQRAQIEETRQREGERGREGNAIARVWVLEKNREV